MPLAAVQSMFAMIYVDDQGYAHIKRLDTHPLYKHLIDETLRFRSATTAYPRYSIWMSESRKKFLGVDRSFFYWFVKHMVKPTVPK